MGFCSNAGSAFIFGVTGTLFPSPIVPWILWAIHIISALLTGVILPRSQCAQAGSTDRKEITILQAFRQSLTVTASVCGWVILFKVVLSILFHTLHLQNGFAKVILSGLFELTGGCIALNEISSLPLRFLLVSALLSFGGICVFMQTASVTAQCGTGLYLHGKLIQVLISTMLSLTLVLLRDVHSFPFGVTISIYMIGIIGITLLQKACRKKLWKLYCAWCIIQTRTFTGGCIHVISEKDAPLLHNMPIWNQLFHKSDSLLKARCCGGQFCLQKIPLWPLQAHPTLH